LSDVAQRPSSAPEGAMERRERALREFLTAVSEDFGVDPPSVALVDGSKIASQCGLRACGCYRSREKKIVLNYDCLAELDVLDVLKVVLHEFYHHVQFLRRGREAFSDLDKPYRERPHEVRAEAFGKTFSRFYEDLWFRILGWRS